MRAGPRAITCPSCGAGLDILGGGRVRAHVCAYCGATLDAIADYRLIAGKRDMPRPDSPLATGAAGDILGVRFTVIGTIGWAEHWQDRTWTWVDHQVYSPTHGYGWLTWEDGHLVFARKTRLAPEPRLLSAETIEAAEHRPRVRLGGRNYTYYASGVAEPTFIEGEFTFIPSLEDRVAYVELLREGEMLAILRTASGPDGAEVEYELMTLPPRAATLESFGIDPASLPAPARPHPTERIVLPPLVAFGRTALVAGAVAAAALGALMDGIGAPVAARADHPIDMPLELPFEIAAAHGLTEIEIRADVANSWAAFEAELFDSEDEPIAEFEAEVARYSGVEDGEFWSEGSDTARLRLALPPGAYTLELARSEAEIDWEGGRLAERVWVTVRQGRAATFWLFGLAAALAVGAGLIVIRQNRLDRRRWDGSDWSDA